jgi:hypothetical protein
MKKLAGILEDIMTMRVIRLLLGMMVKTMVRKTGYLKSLLLRNRGGDQKRRPRLQSLQ